MSERYGPRVPWLILASAGAFVLVEGANRLFDLYRTHPWMDLPSHVASGAVVTAAALWLIDRRGWRTPRREALVANVLLALLWEYLEEADEALTPDPPYLRDVFFWDGVGDVLAALVGGLLVVWILDLWTARSGE